MLESDILYKKLPSSTKIFIIQADRFDVFKFSKKTPDSSADQPINKPQPRQGTTETVHIKEDLMNLYQDCFTGFGKLQCECYHVWVDSSVSQRKTPCRPVPIHQQAAIKQLAEMQAAGILKRVDHATPWINIYIIVNKKQIDKYSKPQLVISLNPSKVN